MKNQTVEEGASGAIPVSSKAGRGDNIPPKTTVDAKGTVGSGGGGDPSFSRTMGDGEVTPHGKGVMGKDC